jgi:hypothetical protein
MEYFECQLVSVEWRERFLLEEIWQDLCTKIECERLRKLMKHTPERLWESQYPNGAEPTLSPILPAAFKAWRTYVASLYDRYNDLSAHIDDAIQFLNHNFLSLRCMHHRLKEILLSFSDDGATTTMNNYYPKNDQPDDADANAIDTDPHGTKGRERLLYWIVLFCFVFFLSSFCSLYFLFSRLNC